MSSITKLDSIHAYNVLRGVSTVHPLITLIDISTARVLPAGSYFVSLYAIFLKQVRCGDLKYGRNYYDYQEGTLVFLAPGQVIGVPEIKEGPPPAGYALLFHPDLIKGTNLGKTIQDFHYFSYDVSEALHLSEKERSIIIDCLENIGHELAQAIDKHSKKLLVSNIELLLNYCDRFYERQFITRENTNKGIVEKFESLLHDYVTSEKLAQQGFPTVAFCAGELHLSANYFGDLIKKETGLAPTEHIQAKIIDLAKERVFDIHKSIAEISYELGFKYPQHFTRLFKQKVGVSPAEYRSLQ